MAVDMFLKMGDIKGESQDQAHKDEIDVLSWKWGMSQSGSMHTGGGGGSGKVNVKDLTFDKFVDKSSPNLMLMCCNGRHYPEATLTVRKAGAQPLEYMTIQLSDVLISSVDTGGNGNEDRLTETITLNFGRMKVSYQPQKKDGTKDGGPVEMAWDIAANVGV